MIKIQIKSIFGSVLFEHESNDNTIKETVIEAVKNKADLQGAYLQGAYLQGADLQGAYLQGAYLRGAYLQGADLQGANLRGADLRGADLWGADLQGADLQGADLQGFKIKTATVFTGLYTYIVIPYITEQNEHRIKMGCHDRSVKEWDENFWNNNNEFPNDGSMNSEQRLMAYQTAKSWLTLAEKNLKTQLCNS